MNHGYQTKLPKNIGQADQENRPNYQHDPLHEAAAVKFPWHKNSGQNHHHIGGLSLSSVLRRV